MFKDFIQKIKSIDKKIIKFMYDGFNFCFSILIISIITLLLYILNPISYLIYESAIILFKISLTFAATFFICAIAINSLKKELS